MCKPGEQCEVNEEQTEMINTVVSSLTDNYIGNLHRTHMLFGVTGEIRAKSQVLDGIEYEITVKPVTVNKEEAEKGAKKMNKSFEQWASKLDISKLFGGLQ